MWLKQSTASQEISLGQFLDSTDGNTEENGLTIANTDIKIRKGGTTTLTNKNSGGATSISNGVYHTTLDATDTNTLGMLEVYVHVAGALATKTSFMVLHADSYDALVTNGLNNFDATSDAVANVTLVGTTTNNSDMRGTDSANTVTPPTVSEFNARSLPSADYFVVSDYTAPANADITSILTDTNELQGNQGDWSTATGFATTAEIADVPTVAEFNARTIVSADYFVTSDYTEAPTVSQILTAQMTESYAADGAAPTLAQCLFLTMQNLQDFNYVGTTQTVKKIDGIATAATYTLNDASAPTSKTRAS